MTNHTHVLIGSKTGPDDDGPGAAEASKKVAGEEDGDELFSPNRDPIERRKEDGEADGGG